MTNCKCHKDPICSYDTILKIGNSIKETESLKAKLDKACSALEFYANKEICFELGARWAREFTVEEIIGYMKINGYFNLADAIKYNFSEQRQSDNGEERGEE